VDVHSGFGLKDRLWFPYARKAGGFPFVEQALAIANLLDTSYPHHVYTAEPQARSYTAHGDLWDHVFDRHRAHHGGGRRADSPVFIPWTLEMGSWTWVRKNPRQALSALGIFNPLLPHRSARVLRRHLTILDFFLRAAHNPDAWRTARAPAWR